MQNTTPRVRRVLALALMVSACDANDDSGEVVGLEDEDDEAADLRAPERIARDGGFVLATALTPPAERSRTTGPLTLRYRGAHVYVKPVDGEFDLDDVVEGEAAEFAPLDVRLVDENGHEWALEGFDRDESRALAAAYRATRGDTLVVQRSGVTPSDDIDDLAGDRRPMASANWTEFDCEFSDKWRYDNGTMSDLEGMSDSQRRPILDMNGTGFSGTAVLIADNLALTAGHVSSALVVGDSLCRRYGTSGTECRTVAQTVVSGNGGGDDDWGLVKFSTSFTGGWNYVLSTGDDDFINDHTPRVAGYPTLRMNEESICGTSSLLEGERNLGDYHSLLQREARLDITAGGGTSGAPYYFFNEGASDYRIFGVHSGRATTTLGNRYARGPKVPYWYPIIVTSAAALGVAL